MNKNHVFVIAELSANHHQNLKIAIDSIKAAKAAGADAIKFQTYTADTLTLNSQREDFIKKDGFMLKAEEDRTWKYVVSINRNQEEFLEKGLKLYNPL